MQCTLIVGNSVLDLCINNQIIDKVHKYVNFTYANLDEIGQ